MKTYATFDKQGNQTGFTTLEAAEKGYYEIPNTEKKWKLVKGTAEEVDISELYEKELKDKKAEKLQQISTDYQDTLYSDVTTQAGHTWKADKQAGIEKTAERINNKRIMAIARKQSSMTFTDVDGKVTTLKVASESDVDEAFQEALEIGDYIEDAFKLKYMRKAKVRAAKDLKTLIKI